MRNVRNLHNSYLELNIYKERRIIKQIAKLKGETQLFKVFQDAGYEGTEDDFYENVFPDLDPWFSNLVESGRRDRTE